MAAHVGFLAGQSAHRYITAESWCQFNVKIQFVTALNSSILSHEYKSQIKAAKRQIF